MSWSLTVPPTPRAEFEHAVDNALATGQPTDLPGMADDVFAAKAALKQLGQRVKKAKIRGSASGHCMQAGEEKTHSDSIQASAHGVD